MPTSPGKLKPREMKYSATELEGLAVVNAVQHFDVYLVTHPFVVVTDHRALVFLNSYQTCQWETSQMGIGTAAIYFYPAVQTWTP